MLASAATLVLALAATAVQPVLAEDSFCEGQNFCVVAGTSGANVVYTVQSAAAGWAALGLGSSMSQASMYVGWLNSTGGITFSARTSNARALPPVSTETIATLPDRTFYPQLARLALAKHSVHGNIAKLDATTPLGVKSNTGGATKNSASQVSYGVAGALASVVLALFL
ncbi:hypothetical protein BC831DRAFT_514997 [Entophlyctis helioformis]|nr:hypothetical protein BC831DRAFT_514997 [Entophlyctis helioformis]